VNYKNCYIITKSNKGFLILIKNEFLYHKHVRILINILQSKQYKKYCINELNAISKIVDPDFDKKRIYFKTKKHAIKAKEWLESKLMIELMR
jgi:hypothetical protein